jgi:peptidoglycan/xylan/chitin deacetylase (PgdA/CDA1 family)
MARAMNAAARAPRQLLSLAIAALLVLPATLAVAVSPAGAASLPVRLEAGPQTGVTFNAGWRVTSKVTVTLSSPSTVTATARRTEPPGGTWLRIAGGRLDGRWVRESELAYVAGFADTRTFAPAKAVSLRAATWELYRFGADGKLQEARPWTTAAATTVSVDRSSMVRGVRHLRVASGTWAGWWIPGRAAAPDPVHCTAGSPPAAGDPLVVRAVDGATGEIALTFDMGGRIVPAMSILRYLELRRVCATIFPTGATAATDEGAELIREIAAHPELFEQGNHTVHHCNLRDGGGGAACPATRPSAAFVTDELQGAEATLTGLGAPSTVPYWRPPYGAVDKALREDASDAGWPVTVMWSTDTIDWRKVAKGGPTAAQSAAKVIAERRAGAVVLMHLGGWTTRNALPRMITGLRDAGYSPTTVSALFRAGD